MYIDLQTQELVCTLAYFGPGMSGKSTNLRHIQAHAGQHSPSQITTTELASERLLFLDILPSFLPKMDNLAVRLHILTTPGESYINTNRRKILEQADAIVFVADSTRSAIEENIDSLNDMWDFINHNESADTLPIVIQFNKQHSTDALEYTQLNPLLNSNLLPSFPADAEHGSGVIETLHAICKLLVESITVQNLSRLRKQAEEQDAEEQALAVPSPTEEPPALRPRHNTLAVLTEPESWLITCCSCETILEVPSVQVGDVFSCGQCSTLIEVRNRETGQTSVVQPKTPTPLPQHSPQPTPQPQLPPQSVSSTVPQSIEPTPYPQQQIPQSLPSNNPPPLQPLEVSTLSDGSGSNDTLFAGNTITQNLQIPGYAIVSTLDIGIHGSRFIVKNAFGELFRALALSETYLAQPGIRESLEQYVTVASNAKHPNLVPIVALRWSGQTPVIISSNIPESETLTQVLARRRTLAPPQAMGIVRQVALALEEAARNGVIHGWVRPDCILMSAAGRIYLDELGVPTAFNFLLNQRMGSSAATEYYLAPEVLNNEPADSRTDIFLLGALLFRMITGGGLVKGYSAHEALVQVRTSGAPSLRSQQSDVSRQLDAFCAMLTEAQRTERFQEYSDLINRLEFFGGGAQRNTMQAAKSNTAQVSNRQVTQSTYRRGKKSDKGQEASHDRRGRRKDNNTNVKEDISGSKRRGTLNRTPARAGGRRRSHDTFDEDFESEAQEQERPSRKKKKSSMVPIIIIIIVLLAIIITLAVLVVIKPQPSTLPDENSDTEQTRKGAQQTEVQQAENTKPSALVHVLPSSDPTKQKGKKTEDEKKTKDEGNIAQQAPTAEENLPEEKPASTATEPTQDTTQDATTAELTPPAPTADTLEELETEEQAEPREEKIGVTRETVIEKLQRADSLLKDYEQNPSDTGIAAEILMLIAPHRFDKNPTYQGRAEQIYTQIQRIREKRATIPKVEDVQPESEPEAQLQNQAPDQAPEQTEETK